jgi:hypothetical protein
MLDRVPSTTSVFAISKYAGITKGNFHFDLCIKFYLQFLNKRLRKIANCDFVVGVPLVHFPHAVTGIGGCDFLPLPPP